MSKLIFNYGVMDSGKSAEVMMKAFLFRSKGKDVLILKPSVDTRSKAGKIESRIGLSESALEVGSETDLRDVLVKRDPDIILVDEAQFLTEKHVEDLANYTSDYGKLCIAYGLLTDFASKMFPASKRLVELSDRMDESPSMCKCGRKATMNFRKGNSTEQVVVGAEDLYVTMCYNCYRKAMLEKPKSE